MTPAMFLIQNGGQTPASVTNTEYDGFIRYALNKRMERIEKLVDCQTSGLKGNGVQPERNRLLLKNLDASLLAQYIGLMAQGDPDSGKNSGFVQYNEIFRVCRDLLTAQQNRKNRLLAGIQETYSKSWANAKAGDVYL